MQRYFGESYHLGLDLGFLRGLAKVHKQNIPLGTDGEHDQNPAVSTI